MKKTFMTVENPAVNTVIASVPVTVQ
jgi:hypothetical protein